MEANSEIQNFAQACKG